MANEENIAVIPVFDLGDTQYEVKFNLARARMYERKHGSIAQIFVKSEGVFTIDQIINLLSVGMKVVGGEFVNPKKAEGLAESLVETYGYMPAMNTVQDAMQRDLAFFFKGILND